MSDMVEEAEDLLCPPKRRRNIAVVFVMVRDRKMLLQSSDVAKDCHCFGICRCHRCSAGRPGQAQLPQHSFTRRRRANSSAKMHTQNWDLIVLRWSRLPSLGVGLCRWSSSLQARRARSRCLVPSSEEKSSSPSAERLPRGRTEFFRPAASIFLAVTSVPEIKIPDNSANASLVLPPFLSHQGNGHI